MCAGKSSRLLLVTEPSRIPSRDRLRARDVNSLTDP